MTRHLFGSGDGPSPRNTVFTRDGGGRPRSGGVGARTASSAACAVNRRDRRTGRCTAFGWGRGRPHSDNDDCAWRPGRPRSKGGVGLAARVSRLHKANRVHQSALRPIRIPGARGGSGSKRLGAGLDQARRAPQLRGNGHDRRVRLCRRWRPVLCRTGNQASARAQSGVDRTQPFARTGQGGRRIGQSRQESVPGEHEPRDPHPDERDPGLFATPAAGSPRDPAAAPGARNDREQRAPPVAHDQ